MCFETIVEKTFDFYFMNICFKAPQYHFDIFHYVPSSMEINECNDHYLTVCELKNFWFLCHVSPVLLFNTISIQLKCTSYHKVLNNLFENKLWLTYNK